MLKELDFRYYTNRIRQTRGQTQEARITYLRVIKDHPTKEKFNYEFARFLRDEKLYKEAEFRYRKTSIIMPKEIIVYTEWGLVLDVQGKLEGQEELFRKVVEREPNSNHGLCNLGAILARKCKFEEAIDVFEKALVDRPNDTLILSNLAAVYLTLGKYDKTVEKLQKALEVNGNHIETHVNLGLANSCLGKDDEAKKNFQRVLDSLGNNSYKKKEILRSLKLTKENLLKEGNDEEKRSHNERFIKALGEFIALLEE